MYLSRRNMLAAGSATLLLGACSSPARQSAVVTARNNADVGIQTYTLREAMEEDVVAALRMIKDVGYDYVELNERDFTRNTATELKQMLDDVGLPARATHIDPGKAVEDVGYALDAGAVLGVDYIIVPWIHDEYRTGEGYAGLAARFNEIGAQALDRDMRFAYHNHQFEFWDIEGSDRTGMQILFDETDPDRVWFELDLFWASLADVDIPALLREQSGRFKLCHIKDMKREPGQFAGSVDYDAIGKDIMVDVGEGDLPFESWFQMNDVSGIEYFIAEHDHPHKPYRNAIATSLNSIRNMRF